MQLKKNDLILAMIALLKRRDFVFVILHTLSNEEHALLQANF